MSGPDAAPSSLSCTTAAVGRIACQGLSHSQTTKGTPIKARTERRNWTEVNEMINEQTSQAHWSLVDAYSWACSQADYQRRWTVSTVMHYCLLACLLVSSSKTCTVIPCNYQLSFLYSYVGSLQIPFLANSIYSKFHLLQIYTNANCGAFSGLFSLQFCLIFLQISFPANLTTSVIRMQLSIQIVGHIATVQLMYALSAYDIQKFWKAVAMFGPPLLT